MSLTKGDIDDAAYTAGEAQRKAVWAWLGVGLPLGQLAAAGVGEWLWATPSPAATVPGAAEAVAPHRAGQIGRTSWEPHAPQHVGGALSGEWLSQPSTPGLESHQHSRRED